MAIRETENGILTYQNGREKIRIEPWGKDSLRIRVSYNSAVDTEKDWALLPKPEIMVLDEPVNGLDPEGIVEVRQLIKRLQEEWGVTVLISSHLLSELSELCTDFSIISHGELIENLSREELLVKCRGHIALQTDDINKTAAVLEDKLQISDYKVIHGDEIHIFERLGDIPHLSKTLTDNGLVITKLNEEGQNLEDYYLEKVGGRNE